MTDTHMNVSQRSQQIWGALSGSKAIFAILLFALLILLGVPTFFASITDHFPGDVGVSRWIQSWETPWLDTFMEGVSSLGLFVPYTIAVVISMAILIFLRKPKEGVLLGLAVLISFLINTLLKLAVDRPRPSPSLVQVTADLSSNSFPSAHAMQTMVFLGMLAFLVTLYVRPQWLRRLIQALFMLFILLTGLSRIYLGAHWPSDVAGGYIFGLALVIAAVWTYRAWWAEPRSSPGTR